MYKISIQNFLKYHNFSQHLPDFIILNPCFENSKRSPIRGGDSPAPSHSNYNCCYTLNTDYQDL